MSSMATLPIITLPNPLLRKRSAPVERIEIERPANLTVRYLDRNGKPQELAASGLLATVIQHEIDHLNGKLIIDYLSRLKRDIVIRRFKKLAKVGAGA